MSSWPGIRSRPHRDSQPGRGQCLLRQRRHPQQLIAQRSLLRGTGPMELRCADLGAGGSRPARRSPPGHPSSPRPLAGRSAHNGPGPAQRGHHPAGSQSRRGGEGDLRRHPAPGRGRRADHDLEPQPHPVVATEPRGLASPGAIGAGARPPLARPAISQLNSASWPSRLACRPSPPGSSRRGHRDS